MALGEGGGRGRDKPARRDFQKRLLSPKKKWRTVRLKLRINPP